MFKLCSQCVPATINILFVQGRTSWLEHYILFTVNEIPQQISFIGGKILYERKALMLFYIIFSTTDLSKVKMKVVV